MDYERLAMDFLWGMKAMHKARPHKQLSEAMHGEAFMLGLIARHNEDVLPGVLCAEMDISSARVAATLNSLEDKGYITRRIDPDDRRRILVNITDVGKTISQRHEREIICHAATLLEQLGEHDAKEYVRITRRLAELQAAKNETP